MFCPKCGNQLKDNAKFCSKCGNPVKIAPKPSVQTEKPAPRSGQTPASAERQTPRSGQASSSAERQAPRSGQTPASAERQAPRSSQAPVSEKQPEKKKSPVLAIVLSVIVVAAVAALAFFFASGGLKKKDKIEESQVSARENWGEDESEAEEETAEETAGEAAETRENGEGASEFTPAPLQEAGSEAAIPPVTCRPDSSYVLSGVRSVRLFDMTDSSHLPPTDAEHVYTAVSAFDGIPETSWQTNVNGGINQSISADFEASLPIRALTFRLGNHRSADWYIRNNRPKRLRVSLGEEEFTVDFPDEMTEFVCPLSRDAQADRIVVTVEDVYPGTEYQDMVIAEIGVYTVSE